MSERCLFQSTLPRGERQYIRHTQTLHAVNFNPRSRVGSDQQRKSRKRFPSYFNPRSRVGSDHRCKRRPPNRIHFNPRSRVGSDESSSSNSVDNFISIHAPAWGATAEGRTDHIATEFQSTLPRGERQISVPRMICRIRYFNPRSRVGSDVYKLHGGIIIGAISIHAPAWGATQQMPVQQMPVQQFQSTLPRGERPETASTPDQRVDFNPRSRVGSDRVQDHIRITMPNFNPRSRVGSDANLDKAEQINIIFQSTLPRGERRLHRHDSRRGNTDFNPRSRVGSDVSVGDRVLRTGYISIHAPAWGATEHRQNQRMSEHISIHAPAWGATVTKRLQN